MDKRIMELALCEAVKKNERGAIYALLDFISEHREELELERHFCKDCKYHIGYRKWP